MSAHRSPVVALAVLVAAALGATACGGGKSTSSSSSGSSSSAAPSSSGAGGKLNVTETEFRIAPDNPSIAKTGQVTLTVANKGKLPHALEIEGVSGEPKTPTIQPGKTAMLKVDFTKKGTFTWYCPIDGHRQKGMEGKITIGGGGSASSGQSTSSKASRSTSSNASQSNGY
jgi:plastocyanin